MRITIIASGFLALAALVSACSSSSSGTGGGDGGTDGSSGDCVAVPIHCAGVCGGSAQAECVNGQWTCPPEPAIACIDAASYEDAGASDALSSDGGLACGDVTCDPATQYCKIGEGGAQPPDGGTNVSYACVAIPACDGGQVTCACIASGCGCTGDGTGAFTVTCQYP